MYYLNKGSCMTFLCSDKLTEMQSMIQSVDNVFDWENNNKKI